MDTGEKIHLGDDPGDDGNNFIWLITDYSSNYYDGSGDAIGWDGKRLYHYELNHCSCYGPFDNKPVIYSLEDLTSGNLHMMPQVSERLIDAVLNKFPSVMDIL